MSTQKKSMLDLWQDSYLAAGNEGYLEDLYETYLSHPEQLAPEWQQFFASLSQQGAAISHAAIREQFLQWAKHKQQVATSGMATVHDAKQEQVTAFINAYRRVGHLKANIDPLGLYQGIDNPSLSLSYHGLSEQDLTSKFSLADYVALGQSQASLADIEQSLKRVYNHTIGFEYMHINRIEEVEWIRERIEQQWSNFSPSAVEKKRLLERLVVADGLEKYLGFKYVGQKRFSLEGGDSLIPLLDTMINRGVQSGVQEVVIGMPHRGRLNVLVNVVGKPANDLFAAFEGKGISSTHSGDVKYHLGYSATVNTEHGKVHLAMAFNPSHLEIVAPVVQGSVRARQRRRKDTAQQQVIPIQMHGDAAFAGQGVVMETFNMSQARWFSVGGSIHIVVNNQVGFTISNPKDARSTTYCTDIAKMVEAPILHVNGNDPEALLFAALFAIDYRQTFKKDIVIDLVCYRRHGHNEADEPRATQPLMYKAINALPAPYQLYAKKLVAEGVIEEDTAKTMADAYRDKLDQGAALVNVSDVPANAAFTVNWQPFIDKPWDVSTKTAISDKQLKQLAQALTNLPENFLLQPQVKKILEAQKKMTDGEMPINWGYAETMAYASLLTQGYPIRLCGQDAARGTFAHRHAVLHEQNSDDIYIPLSHLNADQAQINIVDSLLSEEAVLAFEYGYATAEPNYLVLWEAQFGDFANGAQVVIDQFISSGEQKWGRLCGLVMLLPHGYEGMGPEHSSARLERYLQLCAQENMQVCVPSTPAQIFHLLRRQMLRSYRKPLIIMSPKSLLRHPLAVSNVQDLTQGAFQLVIPDQSKLDSKKVKRVIFCCGKIYYDLVAKRQALNINDIAIIRIEQLYPFPQAQVQAALAPYQQVKDIIWCQEEPENQGAWPTMQGYLQPLLNNTQQLQYIGRQAAASPAVGYHAVHEKEQAAIVADSLMIRND